ncbi:DNA repair exonuclease SbcCD nuclease subunit [Amaricoccus macauensis]|uniref:DNA repair exonuclease SbcCD nuclease subunit n=1 Tax=Amaricoccus macauensis TaxID=57001 RepID=A0A840SUK7_9RHOB|nr:DNA repair exonuclease [Amaricoccus macauensis]MBB5224195.1 DNA repair exonuclease SbcCD nuclease subunit [Amaricoccus macauensis]
MRFLHAADLHLDSPLRSQALRDPDRARRLQGASRLALARLVSAAIEEDVAAVLLAGDIFDNRVGDVTSRVALATELRRLSRAGIATVMIRGNHDALLDYTRYGPLEEGVVILDAARPTLHVRGVAIHGIGFEERHVASSLLPRYPAAEPGLVNIGLMHTSLGGAEGHDPYAPCSEADLLGHGYDYWALGHIHKRFERRSETTLAVMPGIPQGRHAGETGRGSATLVEIDANGVRAREIALGAVAFETIEVDLARAASLGERQELIARALRSAARPDHEIAARLRIRGAGTLAAKAALAQRLAEEACEEIEGVHVEAVRLVSAPERIAPGVVAELAALMKQDAETVGFRDAALALLDDWRTAMPPDVAEAFDPDDIDALIAEGLDAVIARLTIEDEPA